MATRHTLYFSAPYRDMTEWDHIDTTARAIVARHGGTMNGAGTGFGCRDIDWDFPTVPPLACVRELMDAFPEAVVTKGTHED